MSDPFGLSDWQLAKLEPAFPKSHGKLASMISAC